MNIEWSVINKHIIELFLIVSMMFLLSLHSSAEDIDKKVLDALAKHDPHESRIAMRKHFSRLLNALHQTTEEQARYEIKNKIMKNKKRFSLDRMVTM